MSELLNFLEKAPDLIRSEKNKMIAMQTLEEFTSALPSF